MKRGGGANPHKVEVRERDFIEVGHQDIKTWVTHAGQQSVINFAMALDPAVR
jgi:hypothetical protein